MEKLSFVKSIFIIYAPLQQVTSYKTINREVGILKTGMPIDCYILRKVAIEVCNQNSRLGKLADPEALPK